MVFLDAALSSDAPHDQASTSISPLCLASSDSPLMSPSFKNMSVAALAPAGPASKAAATDTEVTIPFK